MRPVDPAELSALIDGELPPDRAAEVRQAIAADPNLRRQYDRLASLDAGLKAYAQAAAFEPRLSLEARPAPLRLPLLPVALTFLVLRLVVKLVSLPAGIALQSLALALFLAWATRRLITASEQEQNSLTRALAPTPD